MQFKTFFQQNKTSLHQLKTYPLVSYYGTEDTSFLFEHWFYLTKFEKNG